MTIANSILDLPDEYKYQPIDAVLRLIGQDDGRAWVLEVRHRDQKILSEDVVGYQGGSFEVEGIGFVCPLINEAGLSDAVSGWTRNTDETEWTAPLYRIGQIRPLDAAYWSLNSRSGVDA